MCRGPNDWSSSPSLPRDSLALLPESPRPTKVSPVGPNQRTQRVHEACCYGIRGVSQGAPSVKKQEFKNDKITRRTHRKTVQGLFFGLRGEGVLDAEHDVGAGAAAGRLLQEVAALERRRQARHRAVAHPPRFTVVVRLPVALFVGAVPDHLLWPGRGRGGVSAVDSFMEQKISRRRKRRKLTMRCPAGCPGRRRSRWGRSP